MKRLLILPMMLMATTAYGAGWDETVTTPSGDDTVMINDVSAAPGSTSQFSSFKNFPVPLAVQALLDDKEPLKGADDNYVTNAEKIVIGNTSNTNTGDQDLSGLVETTGNETIAGVKTFSSSPIVPTPTTDFQAATKEYVDANSGGGGIADGTNPGDITRWSGTEWLPEAPVVLPIASYNTNPIEFNINTDQLGAAATEPYDGMTYRIAYGMAFDKAFLDCDGTLTGLVLTVASSNTRYGTYASEGTVNASGETDISSFGSLTTGQYLTVWASTASTGDATECDIQLTLTTE